jgi:hypothetical protein
LKQKPELSSTLDSHPMNGQAKFMTYGEGGLAAAFISYLSIATEFTMVLRSMAGSRSQATNKVGKNVSTTSGVNDAS